MNDLMAVRSIERHLELIEDELASQVALLNIIKDTLCALLQSKGGSFLVDNDGKIIRTFVNQIEDTIPMGTNGVQG